MAKKAKPTHVSVLVDRSGSMGNMWAETVSQVNTFMEAQKQLEGKLRLSLATFDSYTADDSGFQPVYANVKRKEAVGVPHTILPRGGTPLYDAIGAQIAAVAESLPEGWQASLVIMTDGMENMSTEYTHETLKAVIETKEAEGWQFVFLGANIDASRTASSLGMNGTTVQYDSASVGPAYTAATVSILGYRTSGERAAEEVDVT